MGRAGGVSAGGLAGRFRAGRGQRVGMGRRWAGLVGRVWAGPASRTGEPDWQTGLAGRGRVGSQQTEPVVGRVDGPGAGWIQPGEGWSEV
jgi:hypothetical protein